MKLSLRKADVILLVLFLLIAAVIIFRVNIEATNYLCPDSKAYIGLAQNIKDGQGFYVLDPVSQERKFFSIWPVGYPTLIFLFSAVTGLGMFWASKLMGLFFMGLAFLLLRHLNRTYSFVLASVFGAYTYLEVYSYSWSETPFLPGLLLLAYLTDQVLHRRNITRNGILIFFTCMMLFLLRYIGAFSFAIPGFLTLYLVYRREYKTAAGFSAITVLLAVLSGVYLYTNYKLSGFAAGFERLDEDKVYPLRFTLMVLKGLLNELLIIREFRVASQPDMLLYITLFIQAAVMAFAITIIIRYFNFWQELKRQSFSLTCVGIGMLYFASTLVLRVLSHFDDLYYRFMSPFSLLIFTGLLYTFVSLPDRHRNVVRAKCAIFGFFVLSVLINVPKKFILSQLQQLLLFWDV